MYVRVSFDRVSIQNTLQVRLAWHDAGTFDKNVKAEWPKAGGANGRYIKELNEQMHTPLRRPVHNGGDGGYITSEPMNEEIHRSYCSSSALTLASFHLFSSIHSLRAGDQSRCQRRFGWRT